MAITQNFMRSLSIGAQEPYRFALEVTPDDGGDMPVVSRAIHVDGFGHIAPMLVGAPVTADTDPILWGASVVTFRYVTPGTVVHVGARRAMATGTDRIPVPGSVGPAKSTALW